MSRKTDDREHFDQVYQELFPILYKVAYHITGSESAGEDLCQEAFIRYFKKNSALPTLQDTKFWLLRVVRNLSLNHEKRKGRELAYLNKLSKKPVHVQESVLHEILKGETRRIIEESIQKLPSKLKDVFVLKEYGGLNYKEIGSILKISESNVKVRIFRARNLLITLLDKDDLYVP